MIIRTVFPLNLMHHFSLTAFKILSLLCLIIKYYGVVFLELIMLGVGRASEICLLPSLRIILSLFLKIFFSAYYFL